MSSNFASKSGSGLKVKVRMRWGCNLAAASIACTVLGGSPSSAARVRTVQRPCDSGCWQTRVCTLCRTLKSCLGGRPDRGASRRPSIPSTAKDRRHFPTVIAGICNAAAICWLLDPSAAASTIRLRRANDCGVEAERTNWFSVFRVSGSSCTERGTRGTPSVYKKFLLI